MAVNIGSPSAGGQVPKSFTSNGTATAGQNVKGSVTLNADPTQKAEAGPVTASPWNLNFSNCPVGACTVKVWLVSNPSDSDQHGITVVGG